MKYLIAVFLLASTLGHAYDYQDSDYIKEWKEEQNRRADRFHEEEEHRRDRAAADWRSKNDAAAKELQGYGRGKCYSKTRSPYN